MLKYFRCTQCRARHVIRVTLRERISVELFETAQENKDSVAATLPDKIMEMLNAAGRRGVRVREVQQRLKGTVTAAMIRNVLERLVYDNGQEGPVMDERRGRGQYFVLKSAAWLDASRRDAASVTRNGADTSVEKEQE